MRKAAVRHGDPTTTRGFVIANSSTIRDDGKLVALSGDEATCGECKGIFKIEGTGKGWKENGRSVALDGDRVLCPCKKNYVKVGANPGFWMGDGGSGASQTAIASAASLAESSEARWIGFMLNERGTCEGMSCVAHFADGSSEHGLVDASNKVRFTRSNDSVCTSVEITPSISSEKSATVSEALLSAISF